MLPGHRPMPKARYCGNFGCSASVQNGLESGYAKLSLEDGQKVWLAATYLGSPEDWGLMRHSYRAGSESGPLVEEFTVEPYTYSTKLVEKGLQIIDEIARVTDVTRLFPQASSIPRLPDGPPSTYPFQVEVRERVALLG